jgi:hypothetical protein
LFRIPAILAFERKRHSALNEEATDVLSRNSALDTRVAERVDLEPMV